MPRPPFQLVQHQASDDVVAHLEELLADAKEGKLVGLFYGAMYRQRVYFVDAVGEARRNPTWARGMVGDLWDSLGQLIGSKRMP